MKNEQEFELIDQFLNGILSEEDNQKVIDKCNSFPDFAKKVENYRQLNEVILSANLETLRDKIKKDLTYIDRKRMVKSRYLQLSSIALFLSFIGFIIYNHFNSGKNIDNKVKRIQYPYEIPKEIEKTITEATLNKNNSTKRNFKNIVIAKNNGIILPDKNINKDSLKAIISQDIKQEKTLPDHKEKLAVNNLKIKTDSSDTACNKVIIYFTPHISPECLTKNSATVTVLSEEIVGGTKPYTVKLDNLKNENTTGIFKNVTTGNHTIEIADSNSCISSKDIYIPKDICNVKKSFSFNPDYNETVEIPYASINGTVTIFNKVGNVVIKDIVGNLKSWNGLDNKGNIVSSGLYIYLIEYDNGTRETGEISVLR